MRYRRTLILCVGAALALAVVQLLSASPARNPGALGHPLNLSEATLFERLSQVRKLSNFDSSTSVFAATQYRGENLRLCPAENAEPSAANGCIEPARPERAVALRLIMPGGREHRSSASSLDSTDSLEQFQAEDFGFRLDASSSDHSRRSLSPAPRMLL